MPTRLLVSSWLSLLVPLAVALAPPFRPAVADEVAHEVAGEVADEVPDDGHLCRGRAAAAAVVVTGRRRLVLCAGGVAVDGFPVALGVGGLGKRRAGDHRTPLGTYPLGQPRPSQQFGTFIPVGYPTPAQARAGFTGQAVGIHGPLRAYVAAGRANTASDWTFGCIAVGSDAEIARIAAWVRGQRQPAVAIQ